MDIEKVNEIVKNAKDKSNKDLIDVRDILMSEFNNTKDIIVDLTKHLEAIGNSYEIVNTEIGNRMKI
jgi:hypothetical protein